MTFLPIEYLPTKDPVPGSFLQNELGFQSGIKDSSRLLVVFAGSCSQCSIESFAKISPPTSVQGVIVYEASADDLISLKVQEQLGPRWRVYADVTGNLKLKMNAMWNARCYYFEEKQLVALQNLGESWSQFNDRIVSYAK